jgi:glycosyltransferase involved in cell wall biosynthesis
VLYWSDTNLIGILLKGERLLWLRRMILKAYFRGMHSLLYPGTRTRDYYIWICGRQLAKTKLRELPFPRMVSASVRKSRRIDENALLQVLFVGRLAPEKAIDRLIKAVGLLSPECRGKMCLRIAGDGPERISLEQLVQDLCLERAVQFLGAVPSDQAMQLFNEASVFVLPSHHESWGVVVGEAMAAGLPVIAPFWVGAVADLVMNGHTGIVINDNSPEEIASAIEHFIHNPAEIERMGETARQVINDSDFTPEKITSVLASVIDEAESRL